MEQDLDLLLAKYFSEEASQEEQTLAEGWISAHPEEAEVLKEAWQASQQPRFEPNVDIAWAKVAPQIKEQATPEKISQKTSEKTLQKTNTETTKQRSLSGRNRFRWVAAAAIFITLGVVGWLVTQNSQNEWLTKQVAIKQATPLVLADGSKVWLNKNSQLRYPKEFGKSERKVILQGEAFFDIAKNPAKPFLIESGKTTTKVLGTSFNVNANKNGGEIKVDVVTGKVAFFATQSPKNTLLLTKNQQGVYNRSDNKLTKNTNYDVNDLAWKTGLMVFKQAKVSEVIKVMSGYYGVNFKLENAQLNNCEVTTTLDKLSLKDALEVH